MHKNLPSWAVQPATDRVATKQAYARGAMQTNWDQCNSLKAWAKKQGWPTPWLSFQNAFFDKMLENEETFALALTSGLQITIPKPEHTLSDKDIQEMDEEYENREWRALVAGLRDIRRAVEAGVVVHAEGKKLKSFESFYTWAHGRYYLLEEGYDSWIGDDNS